METLTQQVLAFQRSGHGLEEIVRAVGALVYTFPRLHRGATEDDCGEFYLHFYPRLLRTLRRFRDRGRPFEWYLNAVMRWDYRTYRLRRARHENEWLQASCPELWPEAEEGEPFAECLGAPPALQAVLELDHSGRIPRRSNRRRLLFWTLKNLYRLPFVDLPRLAELTETDVEYLEKAVLRLKEATAQQAERVRRLRERRNAVFCSLRFAQQRLRAQTDADARRALTERCAGLRRTLTRVAAEMSRGSLAPSNREVAAALGVPKGSVDTALYVLKKHVAEAMERAGPGRRLA